MTFKVMYRKNQNDALRKLVIVDAPSIWDDAETAAAVADELYAAGLNSSKVVKIETDEIVYDARSGLWS